MKKVPQYRPAWQPTPQQARRDYKRQRGRKERDAFYNSTAWRKFSALMKQERPLCEPCLERGLTIPTEQIHHLKDWETEAPDLAFDETNMLALCRACHNGMRKKG